MPQNLKFNLPTLLSEIRRNQYTAKKLVLTKCDLTDQDVEQLVSALETNAHIEAIDLSWNNINFEGAKHLSRCCARIRELDLSFNFIGSKGTNFLIENSTFSKLKLNYNQITSDGLKSISKNTHLQWLEVRSNQIDKEGKKYLTENKRIQYIDTIGNTTIDLSKKNVIDISDTASHPHQATSTAVSISSMSLFTSNKTSEVAKNIGSLFKKEFLDTNVKSVTDNIQNLLGVKKR